MLIKKNILVFLLLLLNAPLLQADSFKVSEIVLNGLERIDQGTVLTYLPLQTGSQFDTSDSSRVLHELYKTGFFSEIGLERDGNKIILNLTERPAITEVNFDGNEDVDDEQLKEAMEQIGIKPGRVYHHSLIKVLEQNLRQVYFTHGKYGVKIQTKVEELKDNRVNVDIKISEGLPALIKQITIVGNTIFSDEQLLDIFTLEQPETVIGIDFDGDQYSRPVLTGDQEALKSYYQNRGYINFNILSTQVSISADKKDIFITINIDEGEKFHVEKIDLTGDFVFPEAEIRKMITIKPDEVFSNASMVASKTAISKKLGDEGYAFARVNVIPEQNNENKTVKLTYVVQPGKKAYVRHITFSGNAKSADAVLRREMRLMESAPLNTTALNRSKIRLQRLKFVETVELKTTPVQGTDDQVDIDIKTVERLSGSFNISAAFSQVEGVVFGTSLTQDNLFGTGQSLSLAINTSDANTVYSMTHTDPYYTVDGISRSFEVNYRKRDASEELISNYLIDTAKINVRYGIPLSEYDRFSFGYGLEAIDITLASSNVAQEFVDYVDIHGNHFENLSLQSSFSHDTRNRTVFADDGLIHAVSLDMTVPGGDISYYKLQHQSKFFFSLGNQHALMLRGQLGLGDGYGETAELPFFERFFAGGLRSVRGYRTNSLGPYDAAVGNSVGGDLSIIGGIEWIFPVPFMETPPASVRMSMFYDAGNVFDREETSLSHAFFELKDAIGISYVWLAPIGPLRFSWAKAISPDATDETETFQFSIGSFF
ncbi:MAG: outer membrane protein assembly factor BamA [Gammaproteobacteria bacterium]|nr:outer membrane protein assembly factor BamA [Gammaproteobacteria bacterium]